MDGLRRLPLLLALATPGLASAQCEPLTESGFRALTDRARAAIGKDDVVGHGAVYREMQARLPCLVEQLPRDAWAEFLVGMAVVEFALGRDWETPLRTALGVYPAVARDYGPPEIKGWAPSEGEPAETRPLAPGAVVFVDGAVVTRAPALEGLHVVQRLEGDAWTTRLLVGTPFPEDWCATGDAVGTAGTAGGEPGAGGAEADAPSAGPGTGTDTVGSGAAAREPRPPKSAARTGAPKARGGRTRLVVAGGALAGAGSAAALTAWGIGHAGGTFTKGQADALEWTNIAGWTIAGGGLVVGTLGLVLPTSGGELGIALGPDGIRLGGTFR